jgi:hypothetical protein
MSESKTPRIFFFSGNISRYEDGVFQESISHSPFLSSSSPPIVLYEDFQKLEAELAAKTAALEAAKAELARVDAITGRSDAESVRSSSMAVQERIANLKETIRALTR